MKVWYGRVSTVGQKLEVQKDKLTAYGCQKVFTDKQSGSSIEKREDLKAALNFVREGDELVVTRLDRLARSVRDLVNITTGLAAKKVHLVVLDQSIDTSTPVGKLLFHVLSAIGEFERAINNERVMDGLIRAKRNGVKFWPKPKLTPAQVAELREVFADTPETARRELAKQYGISKSTMYRLIKKANPDNG